MIHVPAPDPFTVFGLPRSLDVDERTLEARYLRLSRECHPDLHRASDTGDCIAVLQRSAEINDAWQVLRDPWRRARALLELLSPGVLDRTKKLDPAFLDEALELAEQVATAGAASAPALRARLQAALADDFAAVRADLQRGDHEAAARRLHASHYHRKALADLEAKS
ncbi:MAG: Fe-S protein assembly co-chaperone HscB [Planctomycetes bacterium]|nr:Fe-S protein assembly co-chaperone HscB [Planctomycetota bacterium]